MWLNADFFCSKSVHGQKVKIQDSNQFITQKQSLCHNINTSGCQGNKMPIGQQTRFHWTTTLQPLWRIARHALTIISVWIAQCFFRQLRQILWGQWGNSQRQCHDVLEDRIAIFAIVQQGDSEVVLRQICPFMTPNLSATSMWEIFQGMERRRAP